MAKPIEVMKTPQKDEETQADIDALEGLADTQHDSIEVELNSHGAVGRGKYTGFGLEVFAGSEGNAQVKPHMEESQSYWDMRDELLQEGVIEISGDNLIFRKNYTFSSPTAAVRILTGSNAPGPLRWKSRNDGTPLRDTELYGD
ncbi:MAG: DUF4357 domain-containing protein [Chloroflexota bacterium]